VTSLVPDFVRNLRFFKKRSLQKNVPGTRMITGYGKTGGLI